MNTEKLQKGLAAAGTSTSSVVFSELSTVPTCSGSVLWSSVDRRLGSLAGVVRVQSVSRATDRTDPGSLTRARLRLRSARFDDPGDFRRVPALSYLRPGQIGGAHQRALT